MLKPRCFLAIIAISLALAGPAFARGGGWHGGGWGWRWGGWPGWCCGWGWGGWGWGGSSVVLGVGGFAPPVVAAPAFWPPVVASPPPVFGGAPVAASPPVAAAPPSAVWYFCPSSRQFYPYVGTCRVAWRTVPTRPPGLILQGR